MDKSEVEDGGEEEEESMSVKYLVAYHQLSSNVRLS